MDEDKINSDVSDKRKAEEDNSPKPNPKRIKLVRPVFSLLAKPTISPTTEIGKSDEQSKEIPKPSNLFEKIVNVDDNSKLPEKSIDQPETIKKSIEQPEAIKKSIDQLEIIKKTIDPLEAVNNSEGSSLVPEEQVDNISEDLDIKNIFSEETKKELENLKKNIFKIEDDGSSSENDSQPKRPRLKRPTFVTSAVENKVESNDTKILDKTNETSKLNFVKFACEENINTIIEKQIITEEKTDKLLEHIVENIKNNEVENTYISAENIIEKKLIVTENVEKIEEKPIATENNDKLVEDNSCSSKNNDILIEEKPSKIESVDNIIAEKTSDLENLCEVLKNDINVKIKHKASTMCTNIQEVEIEKENNLDEKSIIDINLVNEITEGQSINKEVTNYENIIEESNNTIEKSGTTDDDFTSNVILKKFDNSNDLIQNEKSVLNVKLKDNCIITAETNSNEIIKEGTMKYNKDDKNEKSINCTVIDTKEDLQVDKIIESINDDKISNLKIEDHISNKIAQVENGNKCSSDILVQEPSIDMQKREECESQIFKSDILKAALMSKKSPESLLDSSEGQHQLDENVYTTSLEIKKTANLPKIGEETIVNRIEAEIKLATKEQQINKKSQNKILNNVSEMNISKESSISICNNDNITISKTEEPPKWGSAKMNEVEKFLNDSNVTITPICKSQESPKLGKITLKLPKIGNPEIKSETTVRPDVKSELIKKITNKQIAMGDSPLKNALSQPSKSFSDFVTIRPAPKPSAEQIALLEQQILNTPKKRGRPSKALAQQKQLLLQYQQQQKAPEGSVEDEAVFHVPLFDMEDMSGGTGMFDSFDASTPKRGKGMRGKGSRGRRGRGGRIRGRDESDNDTASNRRHMGDEGETYNEEMNQEEETKQVAMIETERLRKEEERERKIEARKRKLKERSDALKEKKMKKKQKAEERRLQWHEKKRLMQEEKARAAEMKKSLPPPQNFDDETRMSADCNNSLSQSTARNFILGEDDLSISGTTNDSIRMKKGRMEVIDLESNKTLTVDQIAEYQWPLEGGELYMIQEQISNFLGVKSFKRKYPGLKRRNVEAEERTFLCDSGLVAESLCDLGLTVLYSSEVLDIMYTDFPEKYEELREYMRLKHAKELSNRQRALMTISSNTDGSKLDLRDRAMEAVANWNANLNKSRLESRKCSMDMQTFIVHYPKNKCKKMTVPKPKIGNYPLALLPGQFCDYYATYSSDDLHYLPINTVMYGPLKSVDKDFPVSLSSQSESEDSSSDDSSDSDDSVNIDDKSGKNDVENGPSDKKGAECKLCFGTADKNKKGSVEPLIHCSKCLTIYHPTCLDMTIEMIPYIKRYNWQCNECKSCAQCKEVADEDKMLFCDLCDRGYHIYCVGLRRVPEGRWHCQECAMCSSCGVSDPGPGDSKWFYEFKKIEKTGLKVYCRTLCAPCSRLWKKGHYCPNCMRCYPIKNVERMTQCNSCDRYLHPECISENTSTSHVVACTICEERAVSRLLTTVPRSLIKV